PQEHMEIYIAREGNQGGQGVGYLEDGTMVIVENGREHIGETMDVMVTQVIQTERGKLIFAEVDAVEPTKARVSPRKPAL
ncbi:MAG: TRAM domain-containing protein, partial [Armatimonadota bacterium]